MAPTATTGEITIRMWDDSIVRTEREKEIEKKGGAQKDEGG
jgi:hypothetical protein